MFGIIFFFKEWLPGFKIVTNFAWVDWVTLFSFKIFREEGTEINRLPTVFQEEEEKEEKEEEEEEEECRISLRLRFFFGA